MKIKVIKTTLAASCPLGIATKRYIEGQSYDIFEELAHVFIKQGWGTLEEEVEQKAINKAPENKAIFNNDETKEIEKVSKKKK
jgi:hypothetical protein